MLVELQHISKHFGIEYLFEDITLQLISPAAWAILGNNGSGKSTLLQIIAGYMLPTTGSITYSIQGHMVSNEKIFQHLSFCSPSMEIIEEFTLIEFLTYHFSFKKTNHTIKHIIDFIGLQEATNKRIVHFSSGMKQRVKLAQAFFADTEMLLLDEPCTNLDEKGIHLYHQLTNEYTKNRLVIVASNDERETSFCSERVVLSSAGKEINHKS